MLTWSEVTPFAHGPLVTVHSNTFSPTAKPVMLLVGLFGEVMVPEPLTSVHVPIAGKITLLPAMVTLEAGVQIS